MTEVSAKQQNIEANQKSPVLQKTHSSNHNGSAGRSTPVKHNKKPESEAVSNEKVHKGPSQHNVCLRDIQNVYRLATEYSSSYLNVEDEVPKSGLASQSADEGKDPGQAQDRRSN